MLLESKREEKLIFVRTDANLQEKQRIGIVSLKYRKALAANTDRLVCMRLIKRLVGKAVKVEKNIYISHQLHSKE